MRGMLHFAGRRKETHESSCIFCLYINEDFSHIGLAEKLLSQSFPFRTAQGKTIA